jgi:hypothetical protein
MGQKSGPVKEPADQVVKEIRRATRRQFSAEEKIRIVLSGLRGEDSIAGGELLHQCAKLRPVGRGAGDFLAEHFFAPGRLQLLDLAALVLRSRRDARVTVDHDEADTTLRAALRTACAGCFSGSPVQPMTLAGDGAHVRARHNQPG